MKKKITVLYGVVIACALSGCVSGELHSQQEKERSALSNKPQAARVVERSEKTMVVATSATDEAAYRLNLAKQKQVDANMLQNVLFPSTDLSL